MATVEKARKIKADARKRSKQRVEARNELASHAIVALSELGYARTGLRDIASLSGRSVGALTYYFDDKIDLISYCVRVYKEQFVRQIDAAMNGQGSNTEVMEAVTSAFAWAIENDAHKHRLWYDIRSQALFEEALRPAVQEIEDNLTAMVLRFLARLGRPNENGQAMYFLLDGLFRVHLQAALEGDTYAPENLKAAMYEVLAPSP
ncbi:transcriptional regulator, TetR family [Marinobacter daqiaonensis]|uniref:Transcriptional regulator, TetR family n=1 Tax=Marinobacter daqiaonensis TaxID=650891 RepID=A0A1I6GYW7_9GAMM|nr:TetR/AcrR family transcriptional regulator [Marinobacter daqiaonensis]SFR47403.1 transcriptional regulator, TetR family [Marinobacter daqiaonensis]